MPQYSDTSSPQNALCSADLEKSVSEGIAYLGPEGSHSHQALQRLLKVICEDTQLAGCLQLRGLSQSPRLCPETSLRRLISAVDTGAIPFGVIPVENALEGSVMESIEALGLDRVNVQVLCEFSVPVKHCLIRQHGTEGHSLEGVISHPQALAQCRETLDARYGVQVVREVANSTSEAVKLLSAKGKNWAAIGTRAAAQLYGHNIICEDLADAPDNATRFLLIASSKCQGLAEQTNACDYPQKTSLCVGLKDRPGVLVDLLLVFKAYQMNMTRIESRPNRQHVGEYLFFIDVDVDVRQPEYERVQMYLEKDSYYLKQVGPYYALGLLEF